MASMTIIFFNESLKGLLLMWKYRFNLLAQLGMFCFLFVGVGFLMGEGQIQSQELPGIMVGFMVWFFAFMAINQLSIALIGEAQIGTLEQMYMSPAPPEWLLLGRVFCSFTTTSISACLMGAVLFGILNVHFPLSISLMVVFLITLAGVFGFGFLLGGLTLVYKQVGAFTSIIQNMLIFMNGTLLPVEKFPPWMWAISQTLPTTQGIVVLREIAIEGQTLSMVWNDGSLQWLCLHSTIYLVLGWLTFKWGENRAKKHGSLGQY